MSEETPTAEQIKKDKEIMEKLAEERKKQLAANMAEGKAERAAAMKEAAAKLEGHIAEKATKEPSE
ncbi:MAG: hypothetical protein ACUVXA_13345 [Candidatus Jordarchaeum sp.]|uniref:hypothetical protein n=1 Tax=Candidatus Jordarchaeum sp. TaxID=2823881 RepID=UPI00404B7E81